MTMLIRLRLFLLVSSRIIHNQVKLMGLALDPQRALKDMQKMGIQVGVERSKEYSRFIKHKINIHQHFRV
jgi:hypothetical protein